MKGETHPGYQVACRDEGDLHTGKWGGMIARCSCGAASRGRTSDEALRRLVHRGTCTVCNESIRLQPNGHIGRHGVYRAYGHLCSGWNRPPGTPKEEC